MCSSNSTASLVMFVLTPACLLRIRSSQYFIFSFCPPREDNQAVAETDQKDDMMTALTSTTGPLKIGSS
jgi:hypothetical protein